jgi:magnesium transporter
MARLIKERHLLLGKIPDSVVFIGHKKVETPMMRVIDFSPDSYQELERIHVRDLPEIPAHEEQQNIRWISVYGLHDTRSIEELGQLFKIDQLTLKSILNTGLRPKYDEFAKYLYISLKLVHFNPDGDSVDSDQLGIVIGHNYILSFHERPIDLFAPLRKQLKDPTGKLRQSGVEYLSYCILESVADSYLQTVEQIGRKVEDLEARLTTGANTETLTQIVTYKKIIHYLLRTSSPVCDFIGDVDPQERSVASPHIDPFYVDLKNQFVQVKEALETYNVLLSEYSEICICRKNNQLFTAISISISTFIFALLLLSYLCLRSGAPELYSRTRDLAVLGGGVVFLVVVIGLNFKMIRN